MQMIGWQNVEADGESLRSLDPARAMSAKGAGRSENVEYRRKQGEGRRPLKASISDHHS
jgi:hypothetical protein